MGECWVFASRVICTVKASLDLFTLRLKEVWTYAVSGDCIYEMERVGTAGD